MDNVKNTSFTEKDLADIQAQLDEIDDEIDFESRPKTIEEMQGDMHSMIAELQAKYPDNSQSDTVTPHINGQPSKPNEIDPDLIEVVKGYMSKSKPELRRVSPSNGRK